MTELVSCYYCGNNDVREQLRTLPENMAYYQISCPWCGRGIMTVPAKFGSARLHELRELIRADWKDMKIRYSNQKEMIP